MYERNIYYEDLGSHFPPAVISPSVISITRAKGVHPPEAGVVIVNWTNVGESIITGNKTIDLSSSPLNAASLEEACILKDIRIKVALGKEDRYSQAEHLLVIR